MKRYLLIMALAFLAHIIYAQKLAVESFVVAADNDMTAQSDERLDTNGKRCAVIKVRVALDGLKFDGAIQGEVIHRMGEYWVYMPANASELHVYHDKYIPTDINFHDYNIGRVKSGVTYVLTLAKPSTATAEQQTQTLTIRYAPTSAMVLVDNKLVNSSNGMASVSLPIGQHSFIVACKGYESEEGMVKLKASAPSNLQITLSKDYQPAQQTAASVQANNSSSSGNTITIPIKDGVSIEMVKVKAGSFMMGATPEMKNPWDDEKPAHRVTLTKDYYLGKYEVTQAQWQTVMGSNPSRFKGDDLPVEMVSWDECQEFISKLNALTGRKFRLPTEAEWEFAARGGNKSQGYQYSGSNSIKDVAWYTDNSSSGTHAVGTKQANELGIYDMSGNVWEWCQDWFGSYGSDSQTNPTGPTSGSGRLGRGGCWGSYARGCRSSYRANYSPDDRNYYQGLRLCLSE